MDLFNSLRKLVDYAPKQRGMTSYAEIKYIEDTLELNKATNDDLKNMRDMCVLMWSRDINPKYGDRRMDAMQSITAVIDLHKHKRGMEV